MGKERSAPKAEDLGQAIESLLADLQPRIESILWQNHIPAQDCEDLLQEIFTSLVRRYGTVQNLEAWFTSALRYQCFLYWRRRRRRLYHAVDEALLEALAEPRPSPAERYDRVHDLERLLPKIPRRCRSVLELRYGMGFTPKEVAKELGYCHSSMSTVIKRCLAALTHRLVVAGYTERCDDA